MKTIGTCKECKWWGDSLSEECDHRQCMSGNFTGNLYDEKRTKEGLSYYHGVQTGPDFGCIHWEPKNPHRGSDFNEFINSNYPPRTADELRIEDLKRENDAAFARIKELSQMIVNLGYDPTKLP